MSPLVRVLAALILGGSACSARTPPAEEPLIDLEDPDLGYRPGGASPDEAASAASVEVPRQREGTLDRAALDQVLAAGPGAMLSKIPVTAVVEQGKFRGWKVQSAPFDQVDLRAGDVVLGVNGRTLQHPLELKLLWEELRDAEHIAVDVNRDGTRFTLRFEVAAGSSAGEARDMVAP